MRMACLCINPSCTYYLTKRSVPITHLGQGLYNIGTVLCVCGAEPLKGVGIDDLNSWYTEQRSKHEQGQTLGGHTVAAESGGVPAGEE